MRLPFIGGAYKGRSTNVASEECINLFQERAKDDPSDGALVNVPGCVEFSLPAVGEVRGLHTFADECYAVVGTNLYKVNVAGTATDLGAIGTSGGIVSMCDNGAVNGNQIAIADGGSLKVYDRSTGVITNTGSVNTDSCTFLDRYVVFTQKDTGQFWWTALDDATSIDPLDFATAEGKGDDLVAVISNRRNIWLLGKETTEVWYNSGDPFARFQGGFSEVGCAAPHSVSRIGHAIVWLGKSDQGQARPMISQGYNPAPLTSDFPQVAYQMGQYTTVEDATAYTYAYEGHDFYVLTFPTENVTWVYDLTSKHWHQRAHIINKTFPNRERYNCHTFAYSKHLVGDYKNGKIYELNSDYHTMDGDIIPNIRTTKGQKTKDEDRLRIRSLQLTGEEGVSGNVTLTYSKDGGHTYSTEREISFGIIGKYSHRAIWRKLGRGRDWVFRITRKVDARTIYTGLIAKQVGDNAQMKVDR